MPEKKNTGPSYETIMRDLEARRFSPIYILMGEESYYIDKISDYIATHVLKPEERDFNQNIVFGADVTASQIVDSAKAYPMMAEKRVVIVKVQKRWRNISKIQLLLRYLCSVIRTEVLIKERRLSLQHRLVVASSLRVRNSMSVSCLDLSKLICANIKSPSNRKRHR